MFKNLSNNLKGGFVLLFATIIWGFAFVFQDMAGEHLGAFAINGVRMIIGGLFLLLFLAFKKDLKIDKATLFGGAISGFALFAASSLQQFGISAYLDNEAAAGKSGFLTALYMVFVPMIAFVVLKRKPDFMIIISLALALPGMYLLCVKGDFTIALADILILLCAITFAIQILCVDHFIKKANPIKFSFVQLTACGIYSLIFMFIFEKPTLIGFKNALLPILFIGVFSSGVAYTMQVVGQKLMNEANKASLIMSLESVFAAIAGVLILNERMTFSEICGCVLVFLAVLLAQTDIKTIKNLILKK